MGIFQYRETSLGSPELFLVTNQGMEVAFLMDSEAGEPLEVYLDGYDMPIHAEALSGLFIGLGEACVSLKELAVRAVLDWPSIFSEIQAEERAEKEHMEYLSSPALTDRI